MTRHFTSREFNHDIAAAKRAARQGPVFISERGKPGFVLLSDDDFREITRGKGSLLNALSFPEVADIEFELPSRTVDPRQFAFEDDD